MNHELHGQRAFQYISLVTIASVLIILVNAVFNLQIPFRVDFLIGFVGTLLVFCIWHAVITKGLRRSILMFGVSYVIAFSAEALGVNFGWIFGHYHYTPVLGISLFGVPFLAALAWEPILYAAFCITDILAPATINGAKSWLARLPVNVWLAGIAALATTAWDMMIDPIAVNEGWWVWNNGGSYLPYLRQGVPIQNFLGWLGVSFIINLIYRLITDSVRTPRRSLKLTISSPLMLYAALYLTASGVSVTVLRRPEVALIGMLAMGPFLVIALANGNLVHQGLVQLLAEGQ